MTQIFASFDCDNSVSLAILIAHKCRVIVRLCVPLVEERIEDMNVMVEMAPTGWLAGEDPREI